VPLAEAEEILSLQGSINKESDKARSENGGEEPKSEFDK